MTKLTTTIVNLAVLVILLVSLPQNVYADYGFSASSKSDYGFNGSTKSGYGFTEASSPGAGSDALNNTTVVSTSYYPHNNYPVNGYPYHNQYKNYAPTANVHCQHCRSTHQYGVHAPHVYNQQPSNFRYYGNAGPTTGR